MHDMLHLSLEKWNVQTSSVTHHTATVNAKWRYLCVNASMKCSLTLWVCLFALAFTLSFSLTRSCFFSQSFSLRPSIFRSSVLCLCVEIPPSLYHTSEHKYFAPFVAFMLIYIFFHFKLHWTRCSTWVEQHTMFWHRRRGSPLLSLKMLVCITSDGKLKGKF